MMTSPKKGTHKEGQGCQLTRPEKVQKSYIAIVSVMERGIGTVGGCSMLNLRAHVQTYLKWFCKAAMVGGQQKPFDACKSLLIE
eukprot:10120236-Prorocentrum_lima.AAC.1